LPRGISAKEPYISTKEAYVSAKNPYVAAKEPHISAKEFYLLNSTKNITHLNEAYPAEAVAPYGNALPHTATQCHTLPHAATRCTAPEAETTARTKATLPRLIHRGHVPPPIFTTSYTHDRYVRLFCGDTSFLC